MTPADLIRAFETLADAPDGVARLRELVLQLAVRGKLVPQDPADEPATRALTRAAEDSSWRLPQRPRKDKLDPNVERLAGMSEVPSGWIECRLEDCIQLINGRAYKQPEMLSEGTPIVRIQNLNGGNSWFYSDLTLPPRQYCDDGDLLFAWSASFGPYIWAGGRAIFHYHIWRILLSEAVSKRFIFYVLMHLTDAVRAQSHGLAMLHMTKAKMERWPILLPPLAEQDRIIARVDYLMGLLDRLEAARTSRDTTRAAMRDAALAALRDADDAEAVELAWARVAERMDDLFTEPADVAPLRQTILQLAVRGRLVPQDPSDEPASELLKRIAAEKARLVKAGEIKREKELPAIEPDEVPFDVPSGWQWSRLGNITSHITSGSRGWNQYYAASGATFIRSQDIKYDRLEYDSRAYVQPPRGAEGTRTRVVAGDWVLTITGANVGKCALLDTVPDEAYVSQHVALLRPANLELGRYGHLWLVGDSSGRFILLKDSYGAKPGLNLQQLRSLVVPLPPLAEQHRIVAKVESLLALCAALETRLAAGQTAQAAFASAAVHHLDGE